MVEKAITQHAPAVASTPLTTVIPVGEGNVGGIIALAVPSHENVVNTKRKRRWRKFKRFRARDQTVIAAKERKVEVIGDSEVLEPNSAETNTVLRKLLRGPRYFDPSNSSWSTCFNCGEEGHVAAFCTSEMKKKQQKPCFVCGSSGHDGKQCSKARACYICKQIGHLARRCPDKEKHGLGSSIKCLKCGQSGHEMFSCENDYSPSDLKEIQCYICRSFGHVCCVDSVDIFSSKVSCYRCGQLGHTGLACSRQRGGKEGEITPNKCHPCGEEGHLLIECKNASKGEAAPISIYNCGEGGDLSEECKNLTKMSNGKEEAAAATPNSGHNCGVAEHLDQAKIPKRKRHPDEEHKVAKSEPKNLKANKRKKQDKDKKITTPQKPPKNNGGSIKAEPGKKSFRQSNKNSSTAPRKPSNTDHMAKAAPGKKSFRPSNKNSWRSSPPRPSYTDHHVTRVAPGDQMSNRLYGGDMVSNGTPYHHHYSHHGAAADITLGGQLYNPQYATGHINLPQSSSSPHMYQYGASAYPGLPRSPHISSSNPHLFQHGYPSPYHDSPHIFSPNPRVFQYEASAYRGSPVSPNISPFNPHRFRDGDSLAYRGSQRSPPRISANPQRFQYGDSSTNPHRFQYGDSSAYRELPRYPHISSSSDIRRVEYGDSLAYRGLPRSPPHISSPGPHEFRYRDSSYLGSLDAPQASAASPFWNQGSNGSWRNQGW